MRTPSTSHRRAGRWIALAVLVASCGHATGAPVGAPDPLVLGEFEDDYGNRFTITTSLWHHQPRARYHILRWYADGQYLIARNDADNPGDGGLWSRIDWMPLPGMPPYAWGFCLSAYQATSAAAAESTQVARRDTPRTGCNGFPFSRMKPVAPDAAGLFDVEWQLVDLNGRAAPTGTSGKPATLRLVEQPARASGVAGCNRFSGPFTMSGNRLQFGALAMTKMACQDGMELESEFADVLTRTREFRLTRSALELVADSRVLARLARRE